MYGARWKVIRAHMQASFAITFPPRVLEERWASIMRQDSAALETMAVHELPISPVTKRPRKTDADDPRSMCTPFIMPPLSPSTAPLHARCCPNFLLAPGSALAMPEDVRRQLKSVYLAAVLRSPESPHLRWSPVIEDHGDECAVRPNASSPTAPLTYEQQAIFDLLRREISMNDSPALSPTKASRLYATGDKHVPLPPNCRIAPCRPSLLRSTVAVDCTGQVTVVMPQSGIARSTCAKGVTDSPPSYQYGHRQLYGWRSTRHASMPR